MKQARQRQLDMHQHHTYIPTGACIPWKLFGHQFYLVAFDMACMYVERNEVVGVCAVVFWTRNYFLSRSEVK